MISSVVLVTLNELTRPGTRNGSSEYTGVNLVLWSVISDYTCIHHSTHKQFQVIVEEERRVTYATAIILFNVTFSGVVIK